MIDRIFFDTNTLVYLFDLSEPIKRRKVKNFIKENIVSSRLIISTQVINEFINVSTRFIENKKTVKEIFDHLNLINELFIISPLYFQTSQTALKLKNRYKFSFWDSLIAASAIENDCNILLTEDLQNNQIINSKLEILNPFDLT